MTIFLAIIIGAAFGFALDRSGATNPTVLGKMLNLTNLGLMKAILLAIGIGSVLMFAGQMLGLVDVAHMSVKSAYAGVFIGGIMLGLGWAASGYCPGTSLAAIASGRRDAFAYVAGGLLGAAAYMATYPMWKASGILSGSKLTVAAVPGAKYDALLPNLSGDLVGLVLGVAFIAIAFMLPNQLRTTEMVAVPAE
ncbi:MAG: DUF6691 family protein [Rhizobiaceae bacterium]